MKNAVICNMRTFKLVKDYYDQGFNIFKKATAVFNPGVTVLVGCNGYGKSTMLNVIESQLESDNIPFIKYDNLTEGGNTAKSHFLFENDFTSLATSMMSSEGEQIHYNFSLLCGTLGNFVRTGKNTFRPNAFAGVFGEKKKEITSNERWVLIDAIDSGLSIDNIEEIKKLFELMEEDAKANGKELYIVVSANSYEVVRNTNGYDVNKCEYVTFKDYEDYRKFVLRCRKQKDKRYEKKEMF